MNAYLRKDLASTPPCKDTAMSRVTGCDSLAALSMEELYYSVLHYCQREVEDLKPDGYFIEINNGSLAHQKA